MARPADFFRDNTLMNVYIAECCRTHNIKKLVSFMSICIFPDTCPYPLRPVDIHNGPPHDSNYGYAYAKRSLDIINRSYRQQYACNFVSVVPCNIYGPYDNWNLTDAHVIPAIIHKCYLAKLSNSTLTLMGSGTALREFIFSIDAAKLTLKIMDEYNEPDPIILSPGQEISIMDVADIICKKMKFTGKVFFDTSYSDGQFRKPSDNAPLKKCFPNFKFTAIEEGIGITVEWFLNNYKIARK